MEASSPFYDANVLPAAYEAPPIARREADDGRAVLELPEGTWELAALPLTRGQTVRGRDGQRPRVQVANTGLRVDVDDVRFENIDFVWEHRASADREPPAMIQLHAASVSFKGCTFEAASPSGRRPAAVRVFGDSAGADSLDSLPTAKLVWTDCVFTGVASGVEFASPLALVLTAENSLFLGPGAVVQLNAAPRGDEPVSVFLRQFTLRDAAGVLQCAYQAVDAAPGEMTIEATGCVFALKEGGALVTFSGAQKPAHLLAHVHWSGHGSLMSAAGALALWRNARGQSHPADESMIDVDGLVRGEIEFAGDPRAGFAASRIVRWSAPLRSTEPPGIGTLLVEGSRQRAVGRGQ
jgi:hypothetical protein